MCTVPGYVTFLTFLKFFFFHISFILNFVLIPCFIRIRIVRWWTKNNKIKKTTHISLFSCRANKTATTNNYIKLCKTWIVCPVFLLLSSHKWFERFFCVLFIVVYSRYVICLNSFVVIKFLSIWGFFKFFFTL